MEITDLNEQELNRRASLQKIQELGINPYPAAEFPVNATTQEIKAGYDPEKGNFNDIKIGDVVEAYTITEIKRTL